MRTKEAIIESAIDKVLNKEEGYVNHPNDSGGATNYGITEKVARANGWQGPMEDLPVSIARQIYRNRYIFRPNYDKVLGIDIDIGEELIDTGVNMGPARASEFFQRILNVMNMQESRYADVFVDADIGDITLDAFKAYLKWRGADGKTVMLRALNGLQSTFYVELAEARKKDESFVFGQILHRVVMEAPK